MLHSGRQEEQCYGLHVSPPCMRTHHAVLLQHRPGALRIQRQVSISLKWKQPAPLENWMWPRPHGGSRKRIPLWLAKDGQAVRRTRRTGEARISLAGEAGWEGVCTYGAVCEAVAGRTGFGKVGYLHCWRRIQKEGRMDAAGEASLASTSSGNAPRS